MFRNENTFIKIKSSNTLGSPIFLYYIHIEGEIKFPLISRFNAKLISRFNVKSQYFSFFFVCYYMFIILSAARKFNNIASKIKVIGKINCIFIVLLYFFPIFFLITRIKIRLTKPLISYSFHVYTFVLLKCRRNFN